MKRKTNYTCGAATGGVEAELSRRSYVVARTQFNAQKVDLLCFKDGGPALKIQVKGISNQNGFRVQGDFLRGKIQNDLFLIVVYVPLSENEPFEYYIMTHKEAQKMWNECETRRVVVKGLKPTSKGNEGLNWGDVKRHKDCWNKLEVQVK